MSCLQICAAGKCYLFDMLEISADVLWLMQFLLEDNGIIKIMHDCRQDTAALRYQKGIDVNVMFDTQVYPAWMLQLARFVAACS